MEIRGSVIVVTGGAKGIGLATANWLQSSGAKVIVFDKDDVSVASLPSCIEGHVLDVTHPEKVKEAVLSVIKLHKQIDVLVNNAGIIHNEPMINLFEPNNMMHSYERFQDLVRSNLDSVFIVTSAIVEQMVLLRTRGVIINLSSISSCGQEGQTAYSAAKAGVNAMTVAWSKEFGAFGIRCNAIAPGFIETSSTEKSLSNSKSKYFRKITPLRRFGQEDDIAQAVSTLITNEYVNGEILRVDGGLRI